MLMLSSSPVTVSRSGVGADFLRAIEKSEKRPDLVSLYRRQAHPDVYLLNGKKLIFYSDKLREVGGRQVTTERASDIWLDVLPNDLHHEGGVDLPKGKKPEALVARLYEMGSDLGDLTLDFLRGAGPRWQPRRSLADDGLALRQPTILMKNLFAE